MSTAVQRAPARREFWLTNVRERLEFTAEQEVVIDLAKVETISSNDLNELIRLQLHARHSGRHLVLKNVREIVREVITFTRLDRLIEMRLDDAHSPGAPKRSLK